MYTAVIETTVWKGDTQPNHTYLLNGDKMLAYIPRHTTVATYFKKPISFSKSGRTFTVLKDNPFKLQSEENIVKVEGSKGSVYWVNLTTQKCSCTGFKYHGKCKHLGEANASKS